MSVKEGLDRRVEAAEEEEHSGSFTTNEDEYHEDGLPGNLKGNSVYSRVSSF